MNQLITTSNENLVPAPMFASDEPPENPHSPARRLVEAVCRSKSLVVLCAALGGTIGAALAILKPNEYASTSAFILQAGTEQVAVAPTAGLPEGFGAAAGLSQNAPHLLTEIDLARRTVEKLGVEKVLQPFRPLNTKSDSWLIQWIHGLQVSLHERDAKNYSVTQAAKVFLANLKVERTSLRSGHFSVGYKANDPKLAQEVLTAYMQEAQDYHIAMYSNPTTQRLAKESFIKAKETLKTANQNFNEIKRKAGVANFEAEYDRVQARCDALSTQIEDYETIDIPMLTGRIKDAKARLKTMDAETTRVTSIPLPNPLVAHYVEKVAELEIELSGYTKDSDLYRTKEGILNGVKARLADAENQPKKFHKDTQQIPNVEFTTLESQIQTDTRELANRRNLLPTKKEQLKRELARREVLEGLYDDFHRFKKDRESATENFRASEMSLAMVDTKEQMASNRISAINPTGPPSFQPVRVGPKRGQMTLLGLAAGIALSVGFIAVRALTDSTIRTPEELEKMLGIRVLATLPELRRRHVRRHENRTLSGC